MMETVVSCSAWTTWRVASTSRAPMEKPISAAPPNWTRGARKTVPSPAAPLVSSVTRTAAVAISNRAMQAMLFRATAAMRVLTKTPFDRVSFTMATTVAGAVETAVYLAHQRQTNLDALAELGFPLAYPSSPFGGIPPAQRPPSMTVSIDTSVPAAFLDALSDGEVTMAEARVVAQMPANQEILRFTCLRCEGAEPRVSEQTLAYLIWKAGSREPLDRLWRWVNPMNDFGYAGLANDPALYRELIEGLEDHSQELADAALARVAPFLPYGAGVDLRFAFTPGCLTGAWRTSSMSGSSVLHIRGGWEEVVERISRAVYSSYLLQGSGGHGEIGSRGLLDARGLTDERLGVFLDLIASSVLEGTLDYVSDPSPETEPLTLTRGVDFVNDLVLRLRDGSPAESARTLIDQGWGSGGPLCAVGRHLARIVAEHDGPLAVTELLERDCVDLFRRGLEIDAESEERRFDHELILMADELSEQFDR